MEKDRTKYNFNGKTNLGKNKLAKEIIEKYLVDNPNKSYKEIKNIFNFKASNSYVIIYDDYDYSQWKNRQKNEIKRYYSPHDNIKYYITNQWDKDTIKPLIKKAINTFGYSIEDSTSLEKDSIINIAFVKETVRVVKKIGNLAFPHKNLLLKGVPGTGKSRAIENIINDKDKLNLENHKQNILRINIHSASSNADLMQGIGISSKDGKIEYKEKQGLILNLIEKATFNPKQPFVLILEEIQENSLNELIGDLIYLIEEDKRAEGVIDDTKQYNYKELVEAIIKRNPKTDYVEVPYLVNSSTEHRKMIMPDNLYIFCTSNYRDDKKVIEDNLLRRFEVLEIYPKYKKDFSSRQFPNP